MDASDSRHIKYLLLGWPPETHGKGRCRESTCPGTDCMCKWPLRSQFPHLQKEVVYSVIPKAPSLGHLCNAKEVTFRRPGLSPSLLPPHLSHSATHHGSRDSPLSPDLTPQSHIHQGTLGIPIVTETRDVWTWTYMSVCLSHILILTSPILSAVSTMEEREDFQDVVTFYSQGLNENFPWMFWRHTGG